MPAVRFSFTEREGKMCRPSGTWQSPILTIRWAARSLISSPLKRTVPAVFSTRLETAIRVVVLPAPLPPIRVMISPWSTWMRISVRAMTCP